MVTVWNNAPLILVGVAVGYLFNPSSSPSIVDKHSTPRNSSSPSSSLPESKPRLPPPRIELGPLQDAVHAFAGWRLETLRTLSQKRANFQNLPLRHAALAEKINYTQKFADVEKSIDRTAEFTSLVAQGARKRYPGLKLDFDIRDGRIPIDDQSVQTELQHIVRDWSLDGVSERSKLIEPLLELLSKEFPDGLGDKSVLVPGAGVGRLGHEIAHHTGAKVDLVEYSQFAIQTYYTLLSPSLTSSPNQHTIHPWSTTWQHSRSRKSALAPVSFPDILPSDLGGDKVRMIEGDFTKVLQAKEDENKYDAIVTLYFIDMAKDFLEFADVAHRVLKPGGIWINLGPLKWPGYSQLQLNAEEVLQLVELTGFDVDQSSKSESLNVYGHHQDSLLQFTYVTQFWAARKRA